jgi:hypothetical protein
MRLNFLFRFSALLFAVSVLIQPVYPQIVHWVSHHLEVEHSQVHFDELEHAHEHSEEDHHPLPIQESMPALVKQALRVTSLGRQSDLVKLMPFLASKVLQMNRYKSVAIHAPLDNFSYLTAPLTSYLIHGPPAF